MKKIALLATAMLAGCATMSSPPGPPNAIASLEKVGTVDARFQSYNVEMVEVTGGRFWAPYGGPKGEMYRMRPATDFTNLKLIGMARLLGPAYIRISGTWANSTYLPREGESIAEPPKGFNQILPRDKWRVMVRFAKAVDARIVTSFPASPGARNADGSWNPDQAQRLVDLTREEGSSIYAAELFNEPTIPKHGAFPVGYSAADYVRDFRIFHAWARKNAPEMKLAGTGGTAEGTMLKHSARTIAQGLIPSEELLAPNPGMLDIVSYHFYGSVSQRCGAPATLKDSALTDSWLDRTLDDEVFYRSIRDRFAPGKPLWLNETAQAACGGSAWASTFLDSFRYVNQLGALARRGVQMVAHNTLDASDYGLIDQDTLTPRPNFWAAVLWRRTMGSTVLAAPQSPASSLRLYAHCLPSGKGTVRGGVGLVAINTGDTVQSISVPAKSEAFVLTGEPIDTREIKVNGMTPTIDATGKLSGLAGIAASGALTVPAKSIVFVRAPAAGNPVCR